MQMLLKCRIKTIICTPDRPTNKLRGSQLGGRSRLQWCNIFTILPILLAGWKGLSFMLWDKWAVEFSGFKHGFGKTSAPLLRLQSCKNREFTDRTPNSHTLLTEVSDIITQSRTFQRSAWNVNVWDGAARTIWLSQGFTQKMKRKYIHYKRTQSL